MIYATKEDLATWLGHLTDTGDPDVSVLPTNVDKLLINASRVVDHATLKRVDPLNEYHLEIAKNATTAQCEFWIDGLGESVDINPNMAQMSGGKTSIQFTNGIPKLAPRARRELWLGGLLNRTVIRV
jgi:hypothetical protein